MAREKIGHHIADIAPLFGQPHAHGTAVNLAALVVHIAHFDQFLEVVADVAALIVAAAFKLPRGDLIIADVEQKQRLHRVDLQHADAFEFVLDHVQQQAVQPLDQRQGLKIACHETLYGHRLRGGVLNAHAKSPVHFV